jgi:hypothetical protein
LRLSQRRGRPFAELPKREPSFGILFYHKAFVSREWNGGSFLGYIFYSKEIVGETKQLPASAADGGHQVRNEPSLDETA